MRMLQVKNITKRYTTGDFTQKALDTVSLNFRKSEFVAILGPSGSGKTTFLNIVGGLDHYDSGDLIINGKSTKHFEESEWDAYRNNSIGFVFQSYNLISHLGIVDNVEMGMTLSGIPASQKRKRAVEVLEQVGLGEHIHKKPNQLSGGQMQRVAIARALANNPDIILADEPTGALDTQTSMQILDLIKKVAQSKLVIMVTHNAKLANKYADRIVQFQDGRVVSDSKPYEEKELHLGYLLKKTSMNFFTALKLSGKNIATKKWRTFLTAFASSMGIIGIALILSLSNGFDKRINEFETDTMSGFPILISQSARTFDIETMREQQSEMLGTSAEGDKYPDAEAVYPYDASEDSLVHANTFTQAYLDYIEEMDVSLLSGISYTRLVNMNILKADGTTVKRVDTAALNFTAYPAEPEDGKVGYLKSSYDLLAGHYPQEMTDLILIVDRYNKVDMSILEALGMDASAAEIDFEDILGYQLKVIPNDDFYQQIDGYFTINPDLKNIYDGDDAITITITGILRANENTTLEAISPGIAYSDSLSRYFIENAQDSEIVAAQKEADYNVLTGEIFDNETVTLTDNTALSGLGNTRSNLSSSLSTVTLTKENMLSMLGADGTPYLITIYPVDFSAKEQITEYLNAWNEGKSDADTILYTDLAATFTNLSGSIMDAITIVLIAFAAISLIVSLIMVGIITYISVLERTREIGVLRALGARKKDIAHVFNAETFIVGTCSGLLGIALGYLLTIPTNTILYNLTNIENIAQLNPLHAVGLVVISVLLTMLGGMIPARIAARKDPVEALRAE